MVWGTTEYQYTIHALGQVESSMDYGASNPNDAITVGLIQWWATRAANVLGNMRSTNPSDWVVGGTLDADLTAHAVSDSTYWSNRYLTLRERQDLHTVMNTTGNKAVQDSQITDDLDNDYFVAGATAGIDKDTHSETMAFFCNIYNRNPRAARRIVGNCGPDSSLARIYSYTINDVTEGAYRTRYTQARDIIAAHDTTGVGTGGITDPPTGGDGGGGTGGTRPSGNVAYITQTGNDLLIINKDSTKQRFLPVRPNHWLASLDSNAGVPPVPGGTPDPTPPTAIADIIAWEMANINAFAYSQGSGRLNPVVSGYTDCSGLQYYAYLKFANKDVGTWTGEQKSKGTLVTTDPTIAKDGSTVHEGDLVLYRWNSGSPSSYDHVAIYKGSNQVISHGGPDPGPDVENHSTNIDTAISGGGSIMVRRYLT